MKEKNRWIEQKCLNICVLQHCNVCALNMIQSKRARKLFTEWKSTTNWIAAKKNWMVFHATQSQQNEENFGLRRKTHHTNEYVWIDASFVETVHLCNFHWVRCFGAESKSYFRCKQNFIHKKWWKLKVKVVIWMISEICFLYFVELKSFCFGSTKAIRITCFVMNKYRTKFSKK